MGYSKRSHFFLSLPPPVASPCYSQVLPITFIKLESTETDVSPLFAISIIFRDMLHFGVTQSRFPDHT